MDKGGYVKIMWSQTMKKKKEKKGKRERRGGHFGFVLKGKRGGGNKGDAQGLGPTDLRVIRWATGDEN